MVAVLMTFVFMIFILPLTKCKKPMLSCAQQGRKIGYFFDATLFSAAAM